MGNVAPQQFDSPVVPAVAEDTRLRDDEFCIVLKKTEEKHKLGVDVIARKNPAALKIKQVKPGLVADWNDSHPDEQVMPEDVIVGVNGERTDVGRIYTYIVSDASPVLTVIVQRAHVVAG